MDFTGQQKTKKPRKRSCFQGFLHFLRSVQMLVWWAHQDSNLGPTGYEPVALPAELWALAETVSLLPGVHPEMADLSNFRMDTT